MKIPPHDIRAGDLIKLDIDRARGKSHTKYGLVLRVDMWSRQMIDLYVLWHDGATFWCTSTAVEKISSD